ncbi:MAG: hypothetical protein ACRD0J_12430, partial [Acidimicrobiales bacterium]
MELPLLVGAAVVAALNLLTRSRLAALRILPRGLHRGLDLVVGAGFALSPLATLHHLDVIGVLVAEGSAAVILRLSFTTRYRLATPMAGPLGAPVTRRGRA